MSTWEGTTTLVTGGAGFIGSHMCENILEAGGKVIAFDNLCQGTKQNLETFIDNKDFTFIEGDCNNDKDLQTIFNTHSIDYVFHYAATVGVVRTTENPLRVLEDIQGIRTILDLSHRHNVKKVAFASSSEVYGEPVELPEKEDSIVNPHLPYAIVKLVGEHYLKSYWVMYKMPTVSFRFFNVYGPRQDSSDYGFVTGIFIRQVLEGKQPTVFGDGSMTRSFVYIDDNIKLTMHAMMEEQTNGEAINIGAHTTNTILELAQAVIAISGKKLEPTFLPLRQLGEIMHRYPDIHKMKKLIGIVPTIHLQEGLKITYDWYKQKLGFK